MLSEGISDEQQLAQIERLRQILERAQGRNIDLKEAAEVAASLLDFYEVLAGNMLTTRVEKPKYSAEFIPFGGG